jgi:hypothetical protein
MGRGNNNNNNNNNNNMPPLEGATPKPPTVAAPNPTVAAPNPTGATPNPTAATPNPTGKSTPPLPPLLNNGNSSGSRSNVNKRSPVLAIENVSSGSNSKVNKRKPVLAIENGSSSVASPTPSILIPKPSPQAAPIAVRPPAALPITNASKVNNSSLVSAAVNKKDPEGYYKLLGLNSSASQSAIRAAYLKLAKNYHPNRGGNVNKFKFLGQAYEVLKNEESRKKYDEQATIANNKPILAITDPSVKAALAATAELGGEAAAAGAKVEQALQQNPKSLNALRQASAAAAAAKETAASAEHKSILERLVNVIRPYVEQLSHGGTRNRKRRAHTRSRRNRRNTKKN